MKLDFFNDTGHPLHLHAGTEGTKRRSIKAEELVTFDLPDGCRPFVKLWEDGTLLVRGNPQTEDHEYEELLSQMPPEQRAAVQKFIGAVSVGPWVNIIDDEED